MAALGLQAWVRRRNRELGSRPLMYVFLQRLSEYPYRVPGAHLLVLRPEAALSAGSLSSLSAQFPKD